MKFAYLISVDSQDSIKSECIAENREKAQAYLESKGLHPEYLKEKLDVVDAEGAIYMGRSMDSMYVVEKLPVV